MQLQNPQNDNGDNKDDDAANADDDDDDYQYGRKKEADRRANDGKDIAHVEQK